MLGFRRISVSRIIILLLVHLQNLAYKLRLMYMRASGGMADAGDLKSPVLKGTCGFDSRLAHFVKPVIAFFVHTRIREWRYR